MTFSYSKPKCDKGTKLIKTRCECRTQKKALKKVKKVKKKTLKKKREKKPKLSKKYAEDWAVKPGNYSSRKVTAKQLQIRRKRIDEIYEVYKKLKKVNADWILKPKDWAYPPEYCYNQELVDNLKGIKQDLRQAIREAKNKKKVKITLKKKKKKVTKITVKKQKRCPKGTRKNKKTGNCESYVKKEKAKNKTALKKTQMGTVVIKSINPSLKPDIEKSVRIMKSFTPSVNKRLQSLQSLTPEFGLFGCKEQEISIEKKGKRKCIKWNSKEAQRHLLANLNSKMMPLCHDIVAPKQVQSNCWFNSFFMVFFISDKGRKFTRYLRQIMITGTRLDSSKLNSRLKWPFFLLNKCIEASLRSVNVGDINSKFAYLMDTNDIIKGIYSHLPKSMKKGKKGLAVKTGTAWNPITYYKGMVEYLDSPLKSKQKQLTMDWLTLHKGQKTKKSFEDILSRHFKYEFALDKIPDFFVVDFHFAVSSSTVKPINITLSFDSDTHNKKQKVKYVLDAAVLRDTKKNHFSAYLTCNGNQYGFDGESHARMQPFKWKNKLEKNTQWRFAEDYDTFFNFKDGYQMLMYYRV